MTLLLATSALAATCAAASDGWHDFLFCTDPLSWADAQAACAAEGAHLADVEDETENDWIVATCQAEDPGQPWWIGFNDLAVEGTFVWDGGATSAYTEWRAGEPNDYAGAEDCARYPAGSTGEWADGNCELTQPYICESGCLWESAFSDGDGDGWGDPATETRQCGLPDGAISAGGDCDDDDGAVHPEAVEVCGGVDDDCDGLLDDADPDWDAASGVPSWVDADGDGWGAGAPVYACATLPGYATVDGDCADGDAEIHPGAAERANDGIDQDCSGADSCTRGPDADGDGWGDVNAPVEDCTGASGYPDNALDCDDGDASVHPEAEEVWYDGVDQACDGGDDDDQDGDGHAAEFTGGDDCDDTLAGVHPDGVEVCDGLDDDCDGVVDEPGVDDAGQPVETCEGCVRAESEGRTYLFCTTALDWPAAQADCVDRGYTLADVLDAAENTWIWAGGESVSPTLAPWIGLSDRVVEGTFAWESGAPVAFTAWKAGEPNGFTDGEDCARYADDADAVWNDADCAGARPYVCELGCVSTVTFLDADEDGYGDDATAEQECTAGAGRVLQGGDCDDHDSTVSPDAAEVCDGLGGDEDCDGLVDDDDDDVDPASAATWYRDADDDGWGNVNNFIATCVMPVGYVEEAGDCDDGDAATHPGAVEAFDGVDNDCNGQTEAGDSDQDGLSDALELALGCDPFTQDTDGDGLGDAAEMEVADGVVSDADGDGVVNCLDTDPIPEACGCASGRGHRGIVVVALVGVALGARRRRG